VAALCGHGFGWGDGCGPLGRDWISHHVTHYFPSLGFICQCLLLPCAKVALYDGTKHHTGEIGRYSEEDVLFLYCVHSILFCTLRYDTEHWYGKNKTLIRAVCTTLTGPLLQLLPRSVMFNFSTPNLVTVNCKVVTYTIKSNTTLRYLSQPC